MNITPSILSSTTTTTSPANNEFTKKEDSSSGISQGRVEQATDSTNPKKVKTLDQVKAKILCFFNESMEFHEVIHQENLNFLRDKRTRDSRRRGIRRPQGDDAREYQAELERRANNRFNNIATPKDIVSALKRLVIVNCLHPYHLKTSSLFLKNKTVVETNFASRQPLNEEIIHGPQQSIASTREEIIKQSQALGAFDPERKVMTHVELKELTGPCPYQRKYNKSSLLIDYDNMVAFFNKQLDPLTEGEKCLFKTNFRALMTDAEKRYSEYPRIENPFETLEFYHDGANRRYFFKYSALCIVHDEKSRDLIFAYRTEVIESFLHGEATYLSSRISQVFLDRLEVDEKALKRLGNLFLDYNQLLKEEKDSPVEAPQLHTEIPSTSIQTLLTVANLPKSSLKKRKGKLGKKKHQIKPVVVLPLRKAEPITVPLVGPDEVFYLKKKDYEIFSAILSKGKINWDDTMNCLRSLQWHVKAIGGSIYKIKYQASRHLISPLNYDQMADQALSDATEEKNQLSKNVHEPHGAFYREPLSESRLKRIRDMLMEAGFNKHNVLLKNES
jgi:hypothetical protein